MQFKHHFSKLICCLAFFCSSPSWAQDNYPVVPEILKGRKQQSTEDSSVTNHSQIRAQRGSPSTSKVLAPIQEMVRPDQFQDVKESIQNDMNPGETFDNVVSEDRVNSALPIIATDVIAPSSVNVGEEANVRLVLSNFGQETVNNLRLAIALPQHLKIIRAKPNVVVSKLGQHQFVIDSIAPDAKSTIEIVVVATEKKPFNIDSELLIASRNRVTVSVKKAELVMTTSTPKQVVIGKKLIHQVTIQNRGDGGAKDVQLKLNIPSALALDKNQKAIKKIGFLPPGESRTVSIETSAMVSGNTSFSYEVAGRNIAPAKISHSTFVARPELFVEAQGPKVNMVNREGVYSISIKNPSDVTISSAKVLVELPQGMTVTTISRAGEINAVAGTAVWTIDHMIPGQTEVIQFKAKLQNEGVQGCKITVQSNETEANQFALNTNVRSMADLAVNIKNETGAVQVGDTATFEIVANNKGSKLAENVEIAVKLPNWIVPEKSAQYTFDATQGRIVFDKVNLATGQESKMKFSVQCKQGGSFVVRSLLNHENYSRPLISEASLFVLEKEREKVGRAIAPGGIKR